MCRSCPEIIDIKSPCGPVGCQWHLFGLHQCQRGLSISFRSFEVILVPRGRNPILDLPRGIGLARPVLAGRLASRANLGIAEDEGMGLARPVPV